MTKIPKNEMDLCRDIYEQERVETIANIWNDEAPKIQCDLHKLAKFIIWYKLKEHKRWESSFKSMKDFSCII